jgi:hypothetical protein
LGSPAKRLENYCPESYVVTVVFDMRSLHAFAFSKLFPWLAQIRVITLKMQLHAVNARRKRLS